MALLKSLGYLAKSVGKSLKLPELGISEKLTGKSTQLKPNVSTQMYSQAKPTVLGTSTYKAPTPQPASKPASQASSGSSSSSSSVTNYASQRAKDENRYASLNKDTSSLYKESQKNIADAEARAAQEKAGIISNLDSAQQALYDKLNSLESPEAAYNKYTQEAGLSTAQDVSKGLREQIDRVNKLLKGTTESVSQRSMQSGLTESQRQRLIASEQDPLRTQLADLSTGLGGATANEESIRVAVNDKLNAFMTGQDQSLEPLKQLVDAAKDKADFVLPEITDRLSREITQYTTERQTRLDTLLAKYSRAESLDDAELAEASALAQHEQQYVNTGTEVTGLLTNANGTGATPTSATPNVQSLGNQALDNIFGLGSSNPFNGVSQFGF